MKNHKPQLTLIKSQSSSLPPRRPNRPLPDAIRDFLDTKRGKCRPTTLITYASVLNRYAAFVGDDHWPPTYRGILAWFNDLHQRQITKTTIHSYWLQLRTFFNFMEKANVLTPEQNPVRFIYKLEVVPEDPKLPPMAFPPEDLDELFRYLEPSAQSGDPEAIRNLALLRLAYLTGVRRTGLAELRLSQLDLDKRAVIVLAIHNKSKKKQESYFDDQVAADLQAWLDIRPEREGFDNVFVSLRGDVGAAMGPKAFYAILQRVCEAAEVERRRFHALRHSSAMDALAAGIDLEKIQKQLGHASLRTTMKYLRGRDEDRAQAYQDKSLSKNLPGLAADRLKSTKSAKSARSAKSA